MGRRASEQSDGLELMRGILVGAEITGVERGGEDELVLQMRSTYGAMHELRVLVFGARYLGDAPLGHHPLCAHRLSGGRAEVPCDCEAWA